MRFDAFWTGQPLSGFQEVFCACLDNLIFIHLGTLSRILLFLVEHFFSKMPGTQNLPLLCHAQLGPNDGPISKKRGHPGWGKILEFPAGCCATEATCESQIVGSQKRRWRWWQLMGAEKRCTEASLITGHILGYVMICPLFSQHAICRPKPLGICCFLEDYAIKLYKNCTNPLKGSLCTNS